MSYADDRMRCVQLKHTNHIKLDKRSALCERDGSMGGWGQGRSIKMAKAKSAYSNERIIVNLCPTSICIIYRHHNVNVKRNRRLVSG